MNKLYCDQPINGFTVGMTYDVIAYNTNKVSVFDDRTMLRNFDRVEGTADFKNWFIMVAEKEEVKVDVEGLKRKYHLSNSEADDAIEFVEELLEQQIAETEANEPYATASIHEMKIALKRVRDLLDLFN